MKNNEQIQSEFNTFESCSLPGSEMNFRRTSDWRDSEAKSWISRVDGQRRRIDALHRIVVDSAPGWSR